MQNDHHHRQADRKLSVRHRAAAVVLLGVAAVLAACSDTPPTASTPTGPIVEARLSAGGNALNAQACQNNGWQGLVTSSGEPFAGQGACVSYGAQGGTLLRTQSITFDALADKTFGDADFAVSATASSGLPVSFSASGDCTVSGATVHLVAAGSCTITARQPGDATWYAAPDVARSFAIAAGAFNAQFALIQPGTFQMGQDGIAVPVHTVTITRSFEMQTTEVTQAQWLAVMGLSPSYFSACGATCPVEQVSWDDVQAFLAALNAMDPGHGYRLPTEAEWEYAARAGTTGDYGVSGDVGTFAWTSVSTTHPVAQLTANAWGLYDMHGNVWEWVQDWFGAYASASVTDPVGPATGSDRVVRGGSWFNGAIVARSAVRGYNPPSTRNSGVGFRLARTP